MPIPASTIALRGLGALHGTLGGPLAANFDFQGYRLIPGVLHAYKASAADLTGYLPPQRKRHHDAQEPRDDDKHDDESEHD